MTGIERLAAFASRGDLAADPVRVDRLKQHMVDTWAARVAGSRLPEGEAVGRATRMFGRGLARSVAAGCAQARCTEIDDIHLTSCTTPGSVIVPTVLALAAEGHLRTVREVCASALAGYELLIRLGVALDGPSVIGKQLWPTQAAAAFGTAAAASRAFRLSAEGTTGALATALAIGAGRPVTAAPASSSRWLTLGIAALGGVIAAFAASGGLVGSAPELPAHAASGLGRRFLFDDVGTKPYPAARQGLAAIEAARRIVADHRLEPADIDEIDVWLPEAQRRIVDRPEIPAGRFASIVSVQYQIALALAAPDELVDIRRTSPVVTDDILALMARVRVRRARDLDPAYPRMWPARTVIHAGGRQYARLERHPFGDARRPATWEDTARKFRRLAGPVIGERQAMRAVREVRRAGLNSPMPALWDLL